VVSHICNQAKATAFVIENETELKRVLNGKPADEALPTVRTFILMDGSKVEDVGRKVISWQDFMTLGENFDNGELQRVMNELAVNTACILLYTSGTTGLPKGWTSAYNS